MDNYKKEIEKILNRVPARDHMVDSISNIARHCTHALAYALIAAAEILAEALRDDDDG